MFVLEFPQNLIGYILFIFFIKMEHCQYYKYNDSYIVHVNGEWGALTLSKYIFADDDNYQSETIQHEYGHRIQSRKLLMLYLFVIGLPSLIWASPLFDGYRLKHHKSYYWFYTEAWANKLRNKSYPPSADIATEDFFV